MISRAHSTHLFTFDSVLGPSQTVAMPTAGGAGGDAVGTGTAYIVVDKITVLITNGAAALDHTFSITNTTTGDVLFIMGKSFAANETDTLMADFPKGLACLTLMASGPTGALKRARTLPNPQNDGPTIDCGANCTLATTYKVYILYHWAAFAELS